MGRIVVVSNRVLEPRKAAQAGGVAVALADVIARHNGRWIGWDGQVFLDPASIRTTVSQKRHHTIVATSLSSEEHAGFYLGYSNSVLWPVMHNRLDLAQFEAGFYRAYSSVNRRFAKIVAENVEPDDIIWVHDYQFIPLALELRQLGLSNPIGFFLHIPFPPAQSFRAVPEHGELAKAIAAYDLVGLQTRADVANLLDYLQQAVGGRLLNDGRVRAFDRIMAIESMPIGIDPSPFQRSRSSHVLVQARHGAKRMIGVDRLDYSKGLPHKLRAFGRFLELAPHYKQKVVLTQIAPPTRESVEAYSDIRKELEALSGSINGQLGELDWVPIHYIHRPVQRSRLPDIYRASHIGLATPLRDGMNLVAKEYVAAQDHADPGVLILSQFAGAAEQLTEALIVNPYNIEETARAMLTAIEMPQSDRIARHSALMASIAANDVTAWSKRFIDVLTRAYSKSLPPPDIEQDGQLEAALTRLDYGGSQPPLRSKKRL